MAPLRRLIRQYLSPAFIETSQLEPPADALTRTIPDVVVGGVKRTPIATLELPHTAMLRGAKKKAIQ